MKSNKRQMISDKYGDVKVKQPQKKRKTNIETTVKNVKWTVDERRAYLKGRKDQQSQNKRQNKLKKKRKL